MWFVVGNNNGVGVVTYSSDITDINSFVTTTIPKFRNVTDIAWNGTQYVLTGTNNGTYLFGTNRTDPLGARGESILCDTLNNTIKNQ